MSEKEEEPETFKDEEEAFVKEEEAVVKGETPEEEEPLKEMTFQLFMESVALMTSALAQAYIVVNVFPYAAYMVLRLDPSLSPSTVGIYAGFLSSVFLLGRACGAYPLGQLSDTYGRTMALYVSLGLCALLTPVFGLSQTYFQACLTRFVAGMCNGTAAVNRTLATELAYGDKRRAKTLMGLITMMRGTGMMVGTALGGYLAEPLEQYPNAEEDLSGHPYLVSMLTKFPFILPNIIGGIFCFLAVILVFFFIGETLENPRPIKYLFPDLWFKFREALARKGPSETEPTVGEALPLVGAEETKEEEGADPSEVVKPDDTVKLPAIWSLPMARAHCWVNWIGSFCSYGILEAFPLFAISDVSGLGVQESSLGNVFATTGVCLVLFQYPFFKWISHQIGFYNTLTVTILFGTAVCGLLPISVGLNDYSSNLTLSAYIFLSAVYATSRILCATMTGAMYTVLNQTVPKPQRGRLNGLNHVGESIFQAAAPSFAGILVTFSYSSLLFPSENGDIVIWTTYVFLGMCAAYMMYTLPRVEGY